MNGLPGLILRTTLSLDEGLVNSVSFSPDGRLVATGWQNAVAVWDAETGELVSRSPHRPRRFYCTDWLGRTDNAMLITGSADKRVTLWRPDTMEEQQTFSAATATINCVAGSPDGFAIAACGNDSLVYLWRSDRDVQVMEEHTDEANIVAWSPDGRTLASCSNDYRVVLWDPATAEPRHVFAEHLGIVNGVAWSPSGKELASCSHDGTIRLFDPDTGASRGLLHEDFGAVHWVGYEAGGKLLAARCADHRVRMWRTDTWELVSILPERTTDFMIPILAFHPSKPVLCTLGRRDSVVRVWDLDAETLLNTVVMSSKRRERVPNYRMVDSSHLALLLKLWPADRAMHTEN